MLMRTTLEILQKLSATGATGKGVCYIGEGLGGEAKGKRIIKRRALNLRWKMESEKSIK